jgi:hypothetical protein
MFLPSFPSVSVACSVKFVWEGTALLRQLQFVAHIEMRTQFGYAF